MSMDADIVPISLNSSMDECEQTLAFWLKCVAAFGSKSPWGKSKKCLNIKSKPTTTIRLKCQRRGPKRLTKGVTLFKCHEIKMLMRFRRKCWAPMGPTEWVKSIIPQNGLALQPFVRFVRTCAFCICVSQIRTDLSGDYAVVVAIRLSF